jgi:2-(1,2-epoxy-1,2-dihydrophenyl)acetyl-CoA isomerase
MKLITRVSDDATLGADAMRAAQELAAGPTRAYGSFRRLLLRSSETGLESHLEEESRALAENASSPHGREGISAFIAKRKADFGR